MVPKVKITPIDTNQPEVEQNGPYDRSYLSPDEPFDYFTQFKDTDPFTHTLGPGPCDILKIFFMTFTIAPIRFIIILLLFCVAWMLARIGLLGLSYDALNNCPIQGWRWHLQNRVRKILRAIFFCMGLHSIEVHGEQAPREIAPMLVCAPHATIVDAIAILLSGSVPVAKKQLSYQPFLGPIGRFLQVVFVTREEATSRKDTLNQIKSRALDQPKNDQTRSWPQMLIFPEGTCTNGQALIKFKSGAFQAGCAVQPILIRQRNPESLDTITWTYNQVCDFRGCLWLTLCQFSTDLSIEFLPVYKPNEIEIQDPYIFASNVRRRMAARLGIPTVERSVSEMIKSSNSMNTTPTNNNENKYKKPDEEEPSIPIYYGGKYHVAPCSTHL